MGEPIYKKTLQTSDLLVSDLREALICANFAGDRALMLLMRGMLETACKINQQLNELV